jgi:hypothetical protein
MNIELRTFKSKHRGDVLTSRTLASTLHLGHNEVIDMIKEALPVEQFDEHVLSLSYRNQFGQQKPLLFISKKGADSVIRYFYD